MADPSVSPPYPELADLLKEGKVVPFLGAGASIGPRAMDESWTADSRYHLPTGGELSKWLAAKAEFPSDDPHDLTDLGKVASYFEQTIARLRLRERLRSVFDPDKTTTVGPFSIHKCLAAVERPILIVTTNYDTLMESALRARSREFHVVTHPTDVAEHAASVFWWKHGDKAPTPVPPNQLDIDLKEATVLYKMHGTVGAEERHDSFVITEDDYVEFLARMGIPAIFLRHFKQRYLLFLGYGLQDWNFRVLLKKIRDPGPSSGGTPPAHTEPRLNYWAIQRDPKRYEEKLWQKRGVDIYNLDLHDFAMKLADAGGLTWP
jgi:hypothetical protein